MPELSKKIRTAVGGMAGNDAPEKVIEGAVLAAQKGEVEIVLVGLMDILERRLPPVRVERE